MANPVSDDERERILELIRSGQPRNDIAKATGRSPSTITGIAQSIGWTFGDTSTAKATAARSAYSADRRAELAAEMTEQAAKLLAELNQPHLVYNFGGRDNTFAQTLLDAPPTDAKRQLVQAVEGLMRTVLNISRHDQRDELGLSAVDDWLRGLIGEA